MLQGTCAVQGKVYKSAPSIEDSCTGCAFKSSYELCNESGQCYEGGIGDNTEIKSIIWVLKGE
jgi:hypothetical protein